MSTKLLLVLCLASPVFAADCPTGSFSAALCEKKDEGIALVPNTTHCPAKGGFALTGWAIHCTRTVKEANRSVTVESGPAKLFYANGGKRLEGTIKDDLYQGLWTEWYENGRKKAECPYKENMRNGTCTEWFEQGQRRSESTYQNDVYDGAVTLWYPNGKKRSERHYQRGQLEGKFTEWDDTGKQIHEVSYHEGNPQGAAREIADKRGLYFAPASEGPTSLLCKGSLRPESALSEAGVSPELLAKGMPCAAGDLDGNGYVDIVVEPKPGSGKYVAILTGMDGTVLKALKLETPLAKRGEFAFDIAEHNLPFERLPLIAEGLTVGEAPCRYEKVWFEFNKESFVSLRFARTSECISGLGG